MEAALSTRLRWSTILVSIFLKKKKKSFNIISLSDNNAVSTAISNDIGYENIFVSNSNELQK